MLQVAFFGTAAVVKSLQDLRYSKKDMRSAMEGVSIDANFIRCICRSQIIPIVSNCSNIIVIDIVNQLY